MRDETAAAATLKATVNAAWVPVTLKMRMGWDHANLYAPRLARIADFSIPPVALDHLAPARLGHPWEIASSRRPSQ